MRHGVNVVRLQALHRAPPQQLTLSVVKPEGGPAASMKPEQKSCVRWSSWLTHCRREAKWSTHWMATKPVIESRRGHQCSETTLTGESRFHISSPLPPWGFEPRSLITGSKRVVHWTSEIWYECSDIAGSPQYFANEPGIVYMLIANKVYHTYMYTYNTPPPPP